MPMATTMQVVLIARMSRPGHRAGRDMVESMRHAHKAKRWPAICRSHLYKYAARGPRRNVLLLTLDANSLNDPVTCG